MIEFLFGWMYKPEIQLSFIDNVIAIIEIVLFIIIASFIAGFIHTKLEERDRKKRDRDGRK